MDIELPPVIAKLESSMYPPPPPPPPSSPPPPPPPATTKTHVEEIFAGAVQVVVPTFLNSTTQSPPLSLTAVTPFALPTV
jgi:hypothetical protein